MILSKYRYKKECRSKEDTMRRKLALVLTVIAGLSLAGCSAKPGNETTAEVKNARGNNCGGER